MTVTYPYEQFLEEYPEFSGVPRDAAASAVAVALHASRGVAGEPCRQLLAGLLAAHRLAVRFDITAAATECGLRNPYETVSAGGSVSASVSSLSVGKTAAAFQIGNDPFLVDLGRTAYGLDYLAALERCVPGVMTVLSRDASESLDG